MKPWKKVTFGLLTGLFFALADELLINGPVAYFISLGLQALTLVYGSIRGRRSSLAIRAFISVLVLHWGFVTCLVGRTTGPGLNGETFGMSLQVFLLYGLIPGFVFLRIFPKKVGLTCLIALFPVALLIATTEAGIEEYLFVKKYHESGIGPTKRWTVSNHWLAYDPVSHRLDGSD